MASIARPPRRENVAPYQPPIGHLPPARPAQAPPPAIARRTDPPKFYVIERLGREPGCGARQVIRLHRSTGGDPYDVAELGPEHGIVPHPLYPHYECTCAAFAFGRDGATPDARWCKHIRGLVRAGLLEGPRREAKLRTAEYLPDGTPKVEAWLVPFLAAQGYADAAIDECCQAGWWHRTLRGCPAIEPGDFDFAEAIVQAACSGADEPPKDTEELESPAPAPDPKPEKPGKRPFGEGIPDDEPPPPKEVIRPKSEVARWIVERTRGGVL